jgi:hypothetical protein
VLEYLLLSIFIRTSSVCQAEFQYISYKQTAMTLGKTSV